MLSGNRPIFPILKIHILLLFINLYPTSSSCPPSSCGHITEIKYPFRLKTDPISCKHYKTSYFLLDCKNNHTVLSANSKRYYVQEINYRKSTIRLVDPGINRKNLSSCPRYSSSEQDWSTHQFRLYFRKFSPHHVAFIRCLSPVNHVNYTKAPFCGNRSNIFANIASEFYILAGENLVMKDLKESCTVDKVALISPHNYVPMKLNSSLAGVYRDLAYGFELAWYKEWKICSNTGRTGIYGLSTSGKWRCQVQYYGHAAYLGLSGFNFLFVGRASLWWICLNFWSSLSGDGPSGSKFLLAARMTSGNILIWLIGFSISIRVVARQWQRRHLCADQTIEEFLHSQYNLAPIKYTYSDIKKMTKNFTQKLGEGGFGIVYKGKLRSGPYVAVKIMEQSVATEEEFINEVGTIGQIHHVNVVQLIDFCVERSKCVLVYEFLPNGSLDRFIFNERSLGTATLTYEKLFNIAHGVACGIEYLHHGCNMQILHFDIKPHNVLLDETLKPKISDFGLAQLHNAGERPMSMIGTRGTIGYMAPEMFYKNMGGISFKADVYSYGMLLMEIAGRRKNMNPLIEDTEQMYFPSWAYEQLYSGKDIEIVDATEEETKIVRKMILVALWCIQVRPSNRPTMNKVVEMLESDSDPQIPPKPFVAPREIAADEGRTRTYIVDCISVDLGDD